MDVKTIAVSVVSITIACVFAVTLLIPVIAESTAETETVRNEGYLRMSHVDTDDPTEYVITYDYYTNKNVITVNGEDVIIKNLPYESFTFNVVFDTNWLIRGNVSSSTGSLTGLQYYGTSGGVSSLSSMTLTCQSGSFTLSGNSGAITKSGTYTDLYIPDNEGYYIMKDKNKPAHMLEDSEFVGFGLTAMVSPANPEGNKITPGLGLSVTGSIEDGATVTPWRGVSAYNSSYSDETVNYVQSTTWNDVYDLSSITFTATLTSTSDDTVTADTPVTYSYFLVPYEIIGTKIIHPDASTTALLNIIPLLVVMGIILGTVGFIALRK